MQLPELGFRPTIGAALARAATGFGDVDYVVTDRDRITYAQAEHRSALLARQLLAHGVGKGTRVGLFYPNGVEWVLWWLAASRIGALVVPFSTLYAPGELAKGLRLGDIHLLIAPERAVTVDVAAFLEEALPGLAAHTGTEVAVPAAPYLRRIWITGGTDRSWARPVDIDEPANDVVQQEILAAVEAQVCPADPAVMIHTSGSTADPKGVVHSHGVLMRQSVFLQDTMNGFTPAGLPTRYLSAMPFFWIGGILHVTGSLHSPLTILTLARTEPGAALELIERERGTGIAGWPTLTQRMRAHPDFTTRDLTTCPSIVDQPADLSLVAVPGTVPRHRSLTESGGGFLTTEVLVVDADGTPVPAGDEGELWIRGPGIMLGYNKREAWEVFDADGWFHTGDRVFVLDGEPGVFYVGRSTELIKTSGANVSPKEVESVLDQHPAVQSSLVVGVGDDERGQEVVAVVVPSDPATFDADLVAADIRRDLSTYKVPRRWVVADADDLPLLTSGKPDRRELTRRIEAGVLAGRH
ncbi:AMP-binding protein [Gordonia pseudamarae]|jgi:acyl-CoA synthetase (AMP-forming)/AMP-acid ligase II|uniref:AMP-binding protein n=1 Tax=Gordonia pseudamarae TaxID=2831662 RepID=A0ABX6IGB0_9ACTN|nr:MULTISPECIES: class I adenylate-forming enzyme family protein [Gordonia]MBD0021444.1 acyl--CoA ligase [Gordonia sp. (in: high G+C Gram-positive bacteria)]QHN25249.1 AMP-binding protein [Gordonia pseudamarae]QHN34181.1 AMP-binding protein [Gordonia pseudamarae]